MGTFNVEIEIGDINAANWTSISALVDTGAFMTAAPASVLRGLGVEPMATELFLFAAGERRRMDVGYARMKLEGKEIITQVTVQRRRNACASRRARAGRRVSRRRSGGKAVGSG